MRGKTKTGGRVASDWVLAGLTACVLGGSALMTGCRVDEGDVHRWESTQRGPEKLVAVVMHDKYAYPLRTEAALSLIRMRPRSGRRIGTELLTTALAEIPADARQQIVDLMTPELERQLKATAAPQGGGSGGPTPPDPSVPFKDATFAMLQHEPPLVTSDASKAALMSALTRWVQTDFETRLENPAQQFGIEQMIRFLGSASVRELPSLITESSSKIDRICGLISDQGDDGTKLAASQALVALAKKVDGQSWIDKQTPIVQDADNRSKQTVTAEQLRKQVLAYQDQELTKVFSAMKRVGGRPIVDFLLQFGSDPKNSAERRKTALAALEGRLDKNNLGDVDRIFAIAKDDTTPDDVRDIAFQRLGELPKDQLVGKLYTLFQNKNWKVRWVAASNVLKSITPKQVPEFFGHLPSTRIGMNEPLTYGGLIAQMAPAPGEPKARDLMTSYLTSGPIGARLTALGYFYQGKVSDKPVVESRSGDGSAIPKCEKDDNCGWTCDVTKAGTTETTESKTIATVGEFAKYCIEPSMVTP